VESRVGVTLRGDDLGNVGKKQKKPRGARHTRLSGKGLVKSGGATQRIAGSRPSRSARSSGRDCRARPSGRTPSGSTLKWRPTTWPTSFGPWPCQGRWNWSLPTLREKAVKIGAKVVAHGRYLVFQMAEVAVPRELFGRILDRIGRLRPPDLAPC